jgi:hypothetical protein
LFEISSSVIAAFFGWRGVGPGQVTNAHFIRSYDGFYDFMSQSSSNSTLPFGVFHHIQQSQVNFTQFFASMLLIQTNGT